MKKSLFTLLLITAGQITFAQKSDSSKNIVLNQNRQRFNNEHGHQQRPLTFLKYRTNYYLMDSLAVKNFRIYWVDSVRIYTPDQLPEAFRSVQSLVKVFYLNDNKHPKAFDSLKHDLKPIKAP